MPSPVSLRSTPSPAMRERGHWRVRVPPPFSASVRELGVSIFLVGPNAQVIAPSIASAWLSSSTELSTALAIIQTAVVFVALAALFQAARRFSGALP